MSCLSVCKFSLHNSFKMVMRIEQTSNLSELKNNILPICLQENYRDSLGEFNNMSYGVFATERVNQFSNKDGTD